MAKQTVDSHEIAQFAKDSSHWWDEDGPFKPLHRLNPVRMGYIRDQIKAHMACGENDLKPLLDIKILDVGCGGGLVCEPLARMGAKTSGIDADDNAIAVATAHAANMGLDIDYKAQSSEELLSNTKNKFDVVLALEIVEHVSDVDNFVQNCVDLCRPGGLVIFSTLNRTPKSFALGIAAAEYILRWVPRGTHSWKKFVKPSELARALRSSGATPVSQNGLISNPLSGAFSMSDTDLDVNYFMTAEV